MKQLLIVVLILLIPFFCVARNPKPITDSIAFAKKFNVTHGDVENVVLDLLSEDIFLKGITPPTGIGIQVVINPKSEEYPQTYVFWDKEAMLLTIMRLPGKEARKICNKIIKSYIKSLK